MKDLRFQVRVIENGLVVELDRFEDGCFEELVKGPAYVPTYNHLPREMARMVDEYQEAADGK